jgi:hypothetical protein
VAQRVLVVRPARVYVDPALDRRTHGLRALSLVEVLDDVAHSLDGDPRVQRLRAEVPSLLHDFQTAQAGTRAMAEQGVRLGIGSFRDYQLPTAVDELEAAIATWRTLGGAWERPDALVDAWLYLALAWLEQGDLQPDSRPRMLALARQALRQMVRLDPLRRLDPDTWPDSVIALWQSAYSEILLDPATWAMPDPEDLRWLARQARADRLLLSSLVVTADEGSTLWLFEWDVAADRLRVVDTLPLRDRPEDDLDALSLSLSRWRACLARTPAPAPEVPDDTGRLWLHATQHIGTFLQGPARRLLLHAGAGFQAHFHLRRSLVVGADFQLGVVARDADRDLLQAVRTTRGSLLLGGAWRSRRWRVSGAAGPSLMHAGRIRATRSFWCRVSAGEPTVFDETRVCRATDIDNEAPGFAAGLAFMGQVDRLLHGPVWMHLHVQNSAYLAPAEGRVLDLPLSVGLGFSLRL